MAHCIDCKRELGVHRELSDLEVQMCILAKTVGLYCKPHLHEFLIDRVRFNVENTERLLNAKTNNKDIQTQ